MTSTAYIPRPPRRSMGLKLLLVCGLALLMSIPALLVVILVMERSGRAERVVNDIAQLVGGPQTFAGPMLAVPYSVYYPAEGEEKARTVRGTYLVFPKTGAGTADLKTGLKQRGLFKAVTWKSDLKLTAHFDLTDVGGAAPQNAAFDWSRAELLVGATDARGADADVVLATAGKTYRMLPASTLASTELNAPPVNTPSRQTIPTHMKFFGTSVADLAKPGAVFDVDANLKFGGAQRIALLAYAEATTFTASGDWPHPSYDGAFIPKRHSTSDVDKIAGPPGGFAAEWSVPYIARGVAGEGDADLLSKLGETSLGVSLVEKDNPHQSVTRSLKYVVLFVGLVFLAYFLFETMQKTRVHPAQYVLIGLAQLIFYLLLLSLAEIIGFDLGFAIAATGTVGLISAYAGWVFKSAKQGLIALACFSSLYALIYILMRLEDRALLVGAVSSFAAIAAVMYFTRNIDWYGSDADKATGEVKEGG